MHRFYTESDLGLSPITITDHELVHQWFEVLKLKTGERVVLFGQGNEVVCVLENIDKYAAVFSIIEPVMNAKEPPRHVHLYCAVLKRDNFEWVVQKATEIGVKEITPIISARTIKQGVRLDRLQKIATEAAEQSGRAVVPIVHESKTLAAAVREADEARSCHIFFDMTGDDIGQIKNKWPNDMAVNLFIGPEGGWSDEEKHSLMNNQAFAVANIGKLTYRAETAALIAVYEAVK